MDSTELLRSEVYNGLQRTAEQDLFGTNTLKLNASADALDQPLAAESRAASLRKEATERLEELAKDEDLSNATSNSTGGTASVDFMGFSGKEVDAFITSLTMILISELGDKTFFIAAVLAMKNSRAVVLCGALGALALMTVRLSCGERDRSRSTSAQM